MVGRVSFKSARVDVGWNGMSVTRHVERDGLALRIRGAVTSIREWSMTCA